MSVSSVHESVKIIRKQCDLQPKLGIICGSGLGVLGEQIQNAQVFNYGDLLGFPECSVDSHVGRLIIGDLDGVCVACLQGRAHFYEGATTDQIAVPIRTLKALGCEGVVLTNAAGSLREEVMPGELVVVNDHINLQFQNVLVGKNDESFGPRFVSMEDAYDPVYRELCLALMSELTITPHEGVYIGVLGPTFETPAEIRAFRVMGADLVGMSTVPGVIVARHCGLRVLTISVVTNLAAGMQAEHLSHEQTLSYAAEASSRLVSLVRAFVKRQKELMYV